MYDLKLPAIRQVNGYQIADFHHQGVILQNALFKKVGLFDENLKLAADGKLLDACINHVKPHLSCQAFVGFEMGGNSSKFFKKSLIEAHTYRPIENGRLSVIVLQIKNQIRNLMLVLESSTLTKHLILPILKWKFRKLSITYGELLPNRSDQKIG
jgi:hypothetical protein